MEQIIYIKLLEEGTDVYRPVKALKVEEGKFKILDTQPEDELWEFEAGELVLCDYKKLEGEMLLVAMKKVN
ncbi:MAG: hypothetical protein WCE64_04760 [Bacteroidales bacterium]